MKYELRTIGFFIVVLALVASTLAISRSHAFEDDVTIWRYVNNTDEAVRYSGSWLDSDTRDAYGGHESTTFRASSYAEFTFEGTAVRWIGSIGPNRGKADIYLNGDLIVEGLDTYNEETINQHILFEMTDLEPNTYTLTIDPTREHGPHSVLANVSIEAFAYIPTLDLVASENVRLKQELEELQLKLEVFRPEAEMEMENLMRLVAPFHEDILAKMIEDAGGILDDTPREKIPGMGERVAVFSYDEQRDALRGAINEAELALADGLVDLETIRQFGMKKDAFVAGTRPAFLDVTGRGNHLQVHGTPLRVPGVFGSALLFDGSRDYGVIAYDPIFDLESFTVEMWFYADADVSDFGVLNTKQDGWLDRNWWFTVWEGTGAIAIRTGDVDVLLDLHTEGSYNHYSWHHVAATYDADEGEASLYIDGELKASGEDISPPSLQEAPIVLAAEEYQGTYRRFFKGALDEIRIWDHARSPEDIKNIFRMELTGSEDGLVGYWNFDGFAQ